MLKGIQEDSKEEVILNTMVAEAIKTSEKKEKTLTGRMLFRPYAITWG